MGGEGLCEQILHMQVTNSKEIIKRALEGNKTPAHPDLRTQLLVWVFPFMERRGKRDLCQQYLGGWLGWFH